MSRYSKILFATDFSESAAAALATTADFARQTGAEIHAIHVLALHEDDPAGADEHLAKAVPTEYDDVVKDRSVIRAVAAEAGIVRQAREEEADLIAIGTHGRSGLKHLLLGSVAERVVQLAPCAVLTIREPGSSFEPL